MMLKTVVLLCLLPCVQALTDEEIQFIKDNAEAVEEALNGKRTQRAEDGTPKLKSDDGNLGIYVNAGKI